MERGQHRYPVGAVPTLVVGAAVLSTGGTGMAVD